MQPFRYQTIKIQTSSPGKRNYTLLKVGILGAAVCIVIFIGAAFYFYFKITKPLTSASHPQSFAVEQGDSLAEVASRLKEQKLIGSDLAFRWYAALRGLAGSVQAGDYELDSNMATSKILENLTAGQSLADEKTLTFLEGKTVKEYAMVLEKQKLTTSKNFLTAEKNFITSGYDFLSDRPQGADLQGYLFPDTYKFSADSAAEDILKKMLDNFDKKLNPELRAEIKRQGRSIFEIVIMASIVEGEVGRSVKEGTVISDDDRKKIAEERRLAAGVFYARLARRYPLESCATINYILGVKKAQLSVEDTKVESPYNTYQHAGLPPGPINNPGLDSILAAIYPTQSDYFYFLSKPGGEMVFSKTLDEHNANKAKYLK